MGGEEWENVRERLVKVGGREEVSVCMSGRLVKVGGREEVCVHEWEIGEGGREGRSECVHEWEIGEGGRERGWGDLSPQTR